MTCTRKDCFYCINEACVSLSVITPEGCGNFLNRKLHRRHPKPNHRHLADIRAHIEAHAPRADARVA